MTKFMREQFQYISSSNLTGVSFLSVRMQEFTYSTHAHEEYSIGITRKGRQDFFTNGVFHKSEAGNIIFFNPEQSHDGCAGGSDELEYDMLYIPRETLINLMGSLGCISPNKTRLSDSLFRDELLARSIVSACHHLELRSSIEEEAAFLSITHSVLRLGGGTLDTKKFFGRKDALLLRAQDFILSNIHQKLSIDDICQVANMSKYHFIRVFNEQYGMTPHQYVINCRLNRVKQQLEQGHQTTKIALELGFSDINHLNRQFRRVFGITAYQYQNQFLINS